VGFQEGRIFDRLAASEDERILLAVDRRVRILPALLEALHSCR